MALKMGFLSRGMPTFKESGGIHHAYATQKLVPLNAKWEAVRPLLKFFHYLEYALF